MRSPTSTRPRTDVLAWLEPALADLEARGLSRTLRHLVTGPDPWVVLDGPEPRRVLHLCSNGYLGLATHPEVVASAAAAAASVGTGAAAARLITGGQTAHRELERALADWKRTDDAVLLSSGYLANLAAVAALVGPGDVVVSDELNHASIIDACRLSRAEVAVYHHADPDDAARVVTAARRRGARRALIVTDGVFSMDGDLAPLPELCDVAETADAMLVVDDAHGSGVVGPDGRGTAALLGCEDRVTAVVATLSKALGSTGGYVAADRRCTDWLRNRARPFIYDTALGPPAVAAASAALAVVRREPERRARVLGLARRLAAGLLDAGVPVVEPAAAIVPVVVGDNRAALHAMDRLLDDDVLAVAIRPPTVPDGTARLRATVMATHTEQDVDHAVAAFARALEP